MAEQKIYRELKNFRRNFTRRTFFILYLSEYRCGFVFVVNRFCRVLFGFGFVFRVVLGWLVFFIRCRLNSTE